MATTTTNIDHAISSVTDKRILIVDDSLTCCISTKRCLTKAGFTDVHYLTDSLLAIDEIVRLNPSMVLLDILMPERSGLDVLRGVVDHPDLSNAIVMMLSSAASDYEAQAINQGAMAVFPKSGSDEEFIRMVTTTFRLAQKFGTR